MKAEEESQEEGAGAGTEGREERKRIRRRKRRTQSKYHIYIPVAQSDVSKSIRSHNLTGVASDNSRSTFIPIRPHASPHAPARPFVSLMAEIMGRY